MAAHSLPCEICDRMVTCCEGTHPGVIAELDTGWAVLGDSQYWPGYSLLMCKVTATELHELPPAFRARHLEEVAQLAEAIHRVVRPHKLNYSLLGNSVPHIHWHVHPRRSDEAAPRDPVWVQMPKPEVSALHRLDRTRHEPLRTAIAEELRTIRARLPITPLEDILEGFSSDRADR